DAFIVTEEKRSVLYYRPTGRCTEIVPPERRLRLVSEIIEEIRGVQRAVAQKLKCIPVELICSRSRDRVDNATRCPSVFGGIVGRQNREFLNCIHAERSTDHAPGTTVRVIIGGDSINAVIIRLGPRAGDSQLRSQPPLDPLGSASVGGHLYWSAGTYSGLKRRKQGPIPRVQRQLANCVRDDCASYGC